VVPGPSQNALPMLERVRVLCVDDEFDIRELLGLLLGGHGAQVVVVETAEQAMQLLRSFRPHVLTSDIGLPLEDGYSFIRRVRALEPSEGGNVPAVALTAYACAEDQRRAMNEGFQVHLAKPVDCDKLVSVITSLARTPERPGVDECGPARVY
jgi:CheY-like chemotaxis protein